MALALRELNPIHKRAIKFFYIYIYIDVNISKKRASYLSGGLKQILSPSIVGKKQKAWIKTIEKYMPKEKTIFSWNRQGII